MQHRCGFTSWCSPQSPCVIFIVITFFCSAVARCQVGNERAVANTDFAQTVEDGLGDHVDNFNPAAVKIQPWLEAMSERESNTRARLRSFRSGNIGGLRNALGQWNSMIDAMDNLRINMLEAFLNQSDSINDVLNDRFAQALATAANISKVASAVENADVSEDRTIAFRNVTNAAMRNNRAGNPGVKKSVTAAGGEWVTDLTMIVNYSVASFTDSNADGSGHDTGTAFTVYGTIAETLELGFVGAHYRYEIGGPTNLERQSNSLDVFLNYFATDHFSVGSFVNYTHIDIEDTPFVDPLLGPISLGDSYSRWAAGVNIAANIVVAGMDCGWTSSLSNGNNESLDQIFDQKNTVWINMLDVQKNWTDSLSTILYASYYTTVKNDSAADGSFWFLGGDVEMAITDRLSVSAGYEATVGYNDYRENRLNTNVTFAF